VSRGKPYLSAMSGLYIGSCSWKYPSWAGLVYSRPRGIDYLAEYARHYNSVEIDQWFWSLFQGDQVKLPDPAVVETYSRAVPEDFRFTVKVPNSVTLTHHYKTAGGTELQENPHFLSLEVFTAFLERLEAFQEKLGPLIFQFEYLNQRKMAGVGEFIERFEAFVSALPEAYSYAVEIRNKNYLCENYFRFLARAGLHPVFISGYYMPPPVPLYERFSHLFQDRVVLRLLGGDRSGIEAMTGGRWDRVVTAQDRELADVAAMIKSLRRGRVITFVNVNNHYEGSSPLTIRRLKALLEDSA
jgi:uncharacterized protein YecE (DUF72 family)